MTTFASETYKGIKVIIKTGSEGPHHDPYSYEEYSFTIKKIFRKPKEVTLHLGLGENLTVNGKEVIPFNGKERFPRMIKYMKKHFGMDLNDFLKKMDEDIQLCTNCGSDNLEWVEGFPGEELLMCQDCREVVDSYVNMGAIE